MIVTKPYFIVYEPYIYFYIVAKIYGLLYVVWAIFFFWVWPNDGSIVSATAVKRARRKGVIFMCAGGFLG